LLRKVKRKVTQSSGFIEGLFPRTAKLSGSTAEKLVDQHMIIKGFIAFWAPA